MGYRRHGHNEIDEPMFTQPIMYSIIKKHKNVLDKYSDQLVAEGVCTKEEVEGVVANYEQVFVFKIFLKSVGCEIGIRLTET